jgi:hypothetical protein
VRVVGPQARRVRLASISPDQADARCAWIARDRVTATARWPSSASKGLRASPSTTSRDYYPRTRAQVAAVISSPLWSVSDVADEGVLTRRGHVLLSGVRSVADVAVCLAASVGHLFPLWWEPSQGGEQVCVFSVS